MPDALVASPDSVARVPHLPKLATLMVSFADPISRHKPRTYTCAICHKPVSVETAVYSSWTHDRFHPECIWKGKK